MMILSYATRGQDPEGSKSNKNYKYDVIIFVTKPLYDFFTSLHFFGKYLSDLNSNVLTIFILDFAKMVEQITQN